MCWITCLSCLPHSLPNIVYSPLCLAMLQKKKYFSSKFITSPHHSRGQADRRGTGWPHGQAGLRHHYPAGEGKGKEERSRGDLSPSHPPWLADVSTIPHQRLCCPASSCTNAWWRRHGLGINASCHAGAGHSGRPSVNDDGAGWKVKGRQHFVCTHCGCKPVT